MKMTDLDVAYRSTLYVLCEDCRVIGSTVTLYRLYATLARHGRNCFFVSVSEEGEADCALVPCEGLEKAAELYRILVRTAVSPCHFLDVVQDLDGVC